MRKIYYIFTLICISLTTYSQVGIGTTNPQGALDIVSQDGGVLFPRVNLTDIFSQNPVINPQGGNLVEGTIIWNLTLNANNQLFPGLYFWGNNKWNKVAVEDKNFTFDKTSNAIPYINGNECSAMVLACHKTGNYQSEDEIKVLELPVSAIEGIICNVNIQIQFNHKYLSQTSMYLMSPAGKTLKLTTGNGNLIANNLNYNLTFSDQASQSVEDYDFYCGCNSTPYGVVATVKPEGSLDNYIQNIYDFMPSNVSSFSSFTDDNPNGIWKLYYKDIHLIDKLTITDVKLNISSYGGQMPSNFVLLSEKEINSADANYITAASTYNANATSNVIQTVITRTTSPVQVTSTNNLPGTILSGGTNSTFNSVRWTAVNNNDINGQITPYTKYYYQLWRKAQVITPVNQNENYSFVLKTEY